MYLSLETNTFPPLSSTPEKYGAWMKSFNGLESSLALEDAVF